MQEPRRKSRWPIRRLILLCLLCLLALFAFFYPRQFHPEREDIPGQRTFLAARERVEQPLRIDDSRVLEDLRILSAPDMEGRAVGTPGGKRAREYIERRYAEIGLEPAFGRSYQQPFTFTPGRGIRFWRANFWQTPQPVAGVNLAGIVRGTVDPSSFLVLSAHYDHLGIRAGKLHPGADDNASGVAAMLALARWFREHPPRHSILFVAFDAEEKGLRGAQAFVGRPPVPLEKLLVDINLDMVSRSRSGEIFLSGLYASPQLKPLVDPVRAGAKPTILYGHDHPRPFWNFDDWTNQSDHGAFAEKGLPFLYLGVADHPDYHRPTDSFERVDKAFYLGVADMLVDLVAALDAAEAAQLRKRT